MQGLRAARWAAGHRRPEPVIRPELAAVVLDIETQHLADEVGGWGNVAAMKVSVAVTWSSRTASFQRYTEASVPRLIDELFAADLVIGFNTKGFDYTVLQPYSSRDLRQLPSLDLLEQIHRALGFRVSLADVAAATLNARKSADGLEAVKMFRADKIDELMDYCEQDVALTRDLWQFARENGHLLYERHGRSERVAVRAGRA